MAGITPTIDGLYCVHFNHYYLAAGSREGRIMLWSMQGFRYLGILGSCNGSVICLQLDSMNRILVSGGSDSSVIVWDFQNRCQEALADTSTAH